MADFEWISEKGPDLIILVSKAQLTALDESCCWGDPECRCWKTGCGDCHDCYGCTREDCASCNAGTSL